MAPNYGYFFRPRNRRRDFGRFNFTGRTLETYSGSTLVSTQTQPEISFGLGNESCWDQLHIGPPYRRGGPFFHYKIKETIKPASFAGIGTPTFRYSGQICVRRPPAGFLDWDWKGNPQSGQSPATEHGAEAWNRFKPGKPVVDLGVAIAELKDLPGLLFKRMDSVKNIANNHLAYEFGWKPLLSDIRKMANLQTELAKRLAQLKRDNGRPVTRRGTLVDELEAGTEVICDGTISDIAHAEAFTHGYYHNGMGAGIPVIQTMFESSLKVWFVGKFQYWIPAIGSQRWRKRALKQLMGLEVTPRVVWEITPWSWLVDWFSNAGDVISNLSGNAAENLTSVYNYVMKEYKNSQVTLARYPLALIGGGTSWAHCSHKLEQLQQFRAPGSPYGFSIDWPDFSSRQLGILSSLGIQRFLKR